MTIKIFNPRKKPYGLLSNNAYYPIEIDEKKYRTVTHYIYSQLLCEDTYKNLVKNQRKVLNAINVYNEIKVECEKLETKNALYKIYKNKVQNDTLFHKLLLQTENKKIIYQSENKILGMESGKGENLLGKTLEKIRHDLLLKEMLEQNKIKEEQRSENIYKIYMVIDALDNLMRIQENDLKEFEDMSYHDILNEGDLIAKQYIPKNIVIQNYHKGYLNHKNIIENILQYPNTKKISNIFRKYNLRDLYDRLKKRKKNIIFNYYLRDLVLTHYPALPPEKIREAINQQLLKLDLQKINELNHDVNLKYKKGLLKIKNNDLRQELAQKIEMIEQKIPSLEEVEEAEQFVFDPIYEEQDKKEEDRKEVEENLIDESPIKQSNQLQMFLENLQEEEENLVDESPIDLIVEEDNTQTFENDTEIVFDKNIQDKYAMFSPLYQSWVELNGLFYPTVTHYLYANHFKNIIKKIESKKNPWVLAHNLITLNDVTEHQYRSEKNNNFYVNIETFNWRQIEQILICEAKKKLFTKAASIKFFNYDIKQLLYLTGKQDIIYNDKKDSCLGVGPLENGENYSGKWLEQKRSKISKEIAQQAKDNADIILLSQMLDNDKRLNDWILERGRDIIHSLVLLTNKSGITEEDVDFVIQKIYFPCNELEISNVYVEVPESFTLRVHKFLQSYLSVYKLDPKIKIDRNGISKIWKYVSLLSYNLLKQSNKAGEMPYIFLSEIQHEVSTDCKIDSIQCIMSAVENLRLILNQRKLNKPIEKVIGSIIYGNPLKIVKGSQKVLTEFENTRLSDLCYTLLRKTRQQNGYRVINRINFFKNLEIMFIETESPNKLFENIEKEEKQQMEDVLNFLEDL
jgi:predicted NAD-dependent protein-ADP-ribosyltransferase YbiA (DUF1768 family)